jgi:hypothetical protein
MFRQRAKETIFVFALLAGLMADLATAQDRPRPAAEFATGWVGFADDGIVSESLVGGAARWYLLPRVSVGPEFAYIHGAHHSHLVVTGNVTWDVLAPTNRRPHRVTPYLVAGGGVFQTHEQFFDGTRAPDLNDDFLKEILAVGVFERIRVDHFEEDPFVARQPLVEDAISLAV